MVIHWCRLFYNTLYIQQQQAKACCANSTNQARFSYLHSTRTAITLCRKTGLLCLLKCNKSSSIVVIFGIKRIIINYSSFTDTCYFAICVKNKTRRDSLVPITAESIVQKRRFLDSESLVICFKDRQYNTANHKNTNFENANLTSECKLVVCTLLRRVVGACIPPLIWHHILRLRSKFDQVKIRRLFFVPNILTLGQI